jgi:hypothetical protein
MSNVITLFSDPPLSPLDEIHGAFQVPVSRLFESSSFEPSPKNLALWRQLLGEIDDRLSEMEMVASATRS